MAALGAFNSLTTVCISRAVRSTISLMVKWASKSSRTLCCASLMGPIVPLLPAGRRCRNPGAAGIPPTQISMQAAPLSLYLELMQGGIGFADLARTGALAGSHSPDVSFRFSSRLNPIPLLVLPLPFGIQYQTIRKCERKTAKKANTAKARG